MRVLVTFGSKLGGTEGIAGIIGEALREAGHEVDVVAARQVRDPSGYGAVLIGGALYANRWHPDSRRFVRRQVKALRRVPVWMFSSGPLDDSADRIALPPSTQVTVLMERVGARGHVTFGGRLEKTVKGFPAAAMAKTASGDWRNAESIRSWAHGIAGELATARPGIAIEHPSRSPWRLISYGIVAWGIWALGGFWLATSGLGILVDCVLATGVSVALAVRYFGVRGAHEPLHTMMAWTAIAAGLEAVTGPASGWAWLPLVCIAAATLFTGLTMSTLPWPKPPKPASQAESMLATH